MIARDAVSLNKFYVSITFKVISFMIFNLNCVHKLNYTLILINMIWNYKNIYFLEPWMSTFTSVSLKTFNWSDFSNSVTEMVIKNSF